MRERRRRRWMEARSTVGDFGWNWRGASGDGTAGTATGTGTEIDGDGTRSSIGTRGECEAIDRTSADVGMDSDEWVDEG